MATAFSNMTAGASGSIRSTWSPRTERLTTMLMTGRLVTTDADHLCRVRNISTGGMMAECEAPLRTGEPVLIELRNLSVVEGRVAWVRRPRTGIQFIMPVEVDVLLHGTDQSQRRPRAPRLSADCPVLIRHVGHTAAATLRDLSQSGCCVATRSDLPLHAEVRVDIPGLPPRHACVRRIEGNEIGLIFRELLSFDAISQWQHHYVSRFAER